MKLGTLTSSFRLGSVTPSRIYRGISLIWSAGVSAAYRAAVMADSPIAYWRLGESSGTVAADETGNYPGTYVGGPTLGVAGAFVGNSAATFNGSQQSINASPTPLLPAGTDGQFSIEVWINVTATSNERSIFSQYLAGGLNRFILMIDPTTSGATARAFFGSGGTFVSLNMSSAIFSRNSWHHIVLVRNGSSAELWVDGVGQGSVSIGSRPILSTGNLIGSFSTSGSVYTGPVTAAFQGGIDEVAIYPTALSPARIAAHYAAGIYDSDATDYFSRITAAGSTINDTNKLAVDTFIKGCKTDGIWTSIKASCILAGADTLAGALVPLVGSAPTNFNFVAGDYSRMTGLKGNAIDKYISTNRNNNVDPQNSKHAAVFITEDHDRSAPKTYLGMVAASPMTVMLTTNINGFFSRVNDTGAVFASIAGPYTGLLGVNRNVSTNVQARANGSQVTVTSQSGAGYSDTLQVFRRGLNGQMSDARLSFYSVGESLDLAQLDARLTTLMSSLT